MSHTDTILMYSLLISTACQRDASSIIQEASTQPAAPYPSASLLKPIYAWIAGPEHQELAEASVRNSSNTATTLIVERIERDEPLPDAIQNATGLLLPLGYTWGSIPITSTDVLALYRSLLNTATEGDEWAQQILSYMERVNPEQRFGLDLTVKKITGTNVAVKTGWDLKDDQILYTHAVCLSHNKIGIVLTSTPVDEGYMQAWDRLLEKEGPAGVLPLHERVAGPTLREKMAANFTLSDTPLREDTS